jgi:hypothetical protein
MFFCRIMEQYLTSNPSPEKKTENKNINKLFILLTTTLFINWYDLKYRLHIIKGIALAISIQIFDSDKSSTSTIIGCYK